MTTLQKTYEAHLKANAGNFNSDLFEDVSLRKEMIALHIANNPKLKASLDKHNVSYEAAAGASSDKLISDDISYSIDRIEWALGNIDWIKKNLPAILVERVFKNIESYEKRATNILESLKSK